MHYFDYIRERTSANVAKRIFPFNWKEIIWNVVTALFYIGAGAAIAAATAYDYKRPIFVFLIALLPAIPLAIWWLRRKIIFQQANLPYLYRLANFPVPVPRETVHFIEDLCNPGGPPRHLVIGGGPDTGKSCLAIGIGTEFAFRCGIGRYTTLAKLLELMDKNKQFWDGRILWPWNDSNLLVVDDIDKVFRGYVQSPTAASVQNFWQYFNSKLPADLKNRRTVWVVEESQNLKFWKQAIADALQINVDGDSIREIMFSTPLTAFLKAPPQQPTQRFK